MNNSVTLTTGDVVAFSDLQPMLDRLLKEHGPDATDDQIDLENEIQSRILGNWCDD